MTSPPNLHQKAAIPIQPKTASPSVTFPAVSWAARNGSTESNQLSIRPFWG